MLRGMRSIWTEWTWGREGGVVRRAMYHRLDKDRSTEKPPLTQPDPDEAQSSLRRGCMPRQKHLSSVLRAAPRAGLPSPCVHRRRRSRDWRVRVERARPRLKARTTSYSTRNNERDSKKTIAQSPNADSPLITPYVASKASTPGTLSAVVQQNNMIDEQMANVMWILINPTHCAARTGTIRPNPDAPFMIARLG